MWSFIQAQETLKLPPEARVWQGAPVLLSTLPLQVHEKVHPSDSYILQTPKYVFDVLE